MMDKLTANDLITFLWVAAALVAFALGVWGLIDKIKAASSWRRKVDTHLSNDKERIDALEEGQKAICRGVLALLSHEINGNSIDKLKEAHAELTDYLIER